MSSRDKAEVEKHQVEIHDGIEIFGEDKIKSDHNKHLKKVQPHTFTREQQIASNFSRECINNEMI